MATQKNEATQKSEFAGREKEKRMWFFGLGLLVCLAVHTLWVRGSSLQSTQRWVAATALLLVVGLWWKTLPNLVILQKMVGVMLMPAGLVWSGLWLTGASLWHRRHYRHALLAFGCIVGFGMLGNGMLGAPLLSWLERDVRKIRPLQEKPFEAILVLGGTTRTDHHGVAHITGAGDRVLLAARMYHNQQTPILVASGSSPPGLTTGNNVKETAEIWRALKIPPKAILGVYGAYNTHTEALAYQRLVRKKGWKRVGLITSAWHMRRALKRFDAAGLKVHPLPADFRGGQHRRGPLWVIPTAAGLYATHLALWEIFGAFVGR